MSGILIPKDTVITNIKYIKASYFGSLNWMKDEEWRLEGVLLAVKNGGYRI